MEDGSTPITLGWRFVHIGVDGESFLLDGLDPWKLDWHSNNEGFIVVAHPSYPTQRHRAFIHWIHGEGRSVRFAAGEFSNCVWGFYLPAATPS